MPPDYILTEIQIVAGLFLFLLILTTSFFWTWGGRQAYPPPFGGRILFLIRCLFFYSLIFLVAIACNLFGWRSAAVWIIETMAMPIIVSIAILTGSQ